MQLLFPAFRDRQNHSEGDDGEEEANDPPDKEHFGQLVGKLYDHPQQIDHPNEVEHKVVEHALNIRYKIAERKVPVRHEYILVFPYPETDQGFGPTLPLPEQGPPSGRYVRHTDGIFGKPDLIAALPDLLGDVTVQPGSDVPKADLFQRFHVECPEGLPIWCGRYRAGWSPCVPPVWS